MQPDFEKAGGLIPAIAQDAQSGKVLMLAWVNEFAWKETIRTGWAHYWSRSRQKLWKKGESSGHTQRIIEIRIDCDADAILYLVEQKGAACHEGYASCFFRSLGTGGDEPKIMEPKIQL
ncbi:MAG: phosphoribosyl-AMP cyclohydrolase [Spirochaetota bacterium]|jgi:phosphoribosyl-AMP cyclohydrolase|nr:phosphoribosyl-AMP cyclohydrolase [Spirochaetota bacterium]